MTIVNLPRQIQMILKKKSRKFSEKLANFFFESALFKGMKSHDADPGGVRLWYQITGRTLATNLA